MIESTPHQNLSHPPEPPLAPTAPPCELDLIGFALLLLRNIRLILGCGLLAFLVTAVVMLRAKPRFASTAVMIVPQETLSSTSLQAQLSLGTLGITSGAYELYSDILKSRNIADRIINDYQLVEVYKTKRLDATEGQLAARTKIVSTSDGVFRVTVEDENMQRAADIANDYLRQLDLLNSSLLLSSASTQRAFIERQLIQEKNALADAEVALKQVQESSNGLPPDLQANASESAIENTRANLRATQIRLDSLLTGYTESNPEVIRLRSQIAGLAAQLESLQRGAPSDVNGVPTAKVPQEALVYTRRLRDVKFNETLFDLLEKEFETAKEREAKQPSIVEVLDAAQPSDHKAWPKRTFSCLVALVLGSLFGILLVCIRAFAAAVMRVPGNLSRFKDLLALYKSWFGLKA